MGDNVEQVPAPTENFYNWRDSDESINSLGLPVLRRREKPKVEKGKKEAVESVALEVLETGNDMVREVQSRLERWETYAEKREVLSAWEARQADFKRLYFATENVSLRKRVNKAAKAYIRLLTQIKQERIEDGGTPFIVPLDTTVDEVEGILEAMEHRLEELGEFPAEEEEPAGGEKSTILKIGGALVLLVGIGLIAYNFEAIKQGIGHHISGGHPGNGPKAPIHNGPPVHNKPPVHPKAPVKHPAGGGSGFGLHHGAWGWGHRLS